MPPTLPNLMDIPLSIQEFRRRSDIRSKQPDREDNLSVRLLREMIDNQIYKIHPEEPSAQWLQKKLNQGKKDEVIALLRFVLLTKPPTD